MRLGPERAQIMGAPKGLLPRSAAAGGPVPPAGWPGHCLATAGGAALPQRSVPNTARNTNTKRPRLLPATERKRNSDASPHGLLSDTSTNTNNIQESAQQTKT